MKIVHESVLNVPDELIKQLEVSEQDILEEHNESIENKPTNEDRARAELQEEIEAFDEVMRLGSIKAATLEPPAITKQDTKYWSVAKGFGSPAAFYPYKDAAGVTVGYIVRWDIKIASGGTKKEVRPYIYDFARKQWRTKFFGQGLDNSRPLYNLPELIARSDATVMIAEGERTVKAATILFPEFVATTSSGGADSAKKTDWQHLKDRDIIFCPDAGEAGELYLKNVTRELQKLGSRISKLLEPSKLSPYVIQDGVIKKREGEIPKGYDLADALKEGWTAEFIKQAQGLPEFYPFFKEGSATGIDLIKLKEGEELFSLQDGTFKLQPSLLEKVIIKEGDDGIEVTYQPLCGYLKPTHEIRDIDNSWGMLAEFKDKNGITRETFLKRTDLLGEKGAVEILQDQGLKIILGHKNYFCINQYLNGFKPESKAIGVDMVGWQGDCTTYMLPFADDSRNSYTCEKENYQPVTYIFQQQGVVTRSLKKKGTLSEWKRTVGAVTRGNHLHTFAILAALAAPSLKLLNEEGGFFHYAGNTSIGKTTLLHVAKSVWGYDKLDTFRKTDNALESTCKNANDGAIFADEIGEIEPDALDKAIYMIGNGVTKGRADRNGNVKFIAHFTVIAQTTGEIGLEAKLAEKNKKAKGGQLIRMAELDADRHKGFNTFDVLNINPDTGGKFSGGKEQAEYLKTHANLNCGVVIDHYLTELVKDTDGFVADLKEAKTHWLKTKFTGDEGVEVSRMARRFSTIYANGIMAVAFGTIPHSVAEIKACLNATFDNWLERFGGDSSYELKTMLDDIYKLCIEQQHSRFYNAEPEAEEKVNLPREKAGYWKMETGKDGLIVLSEFWILPKVFERDILKGKDKKVFYPLLVKEGYLKQEEKGRYDTKRRPKNESRQRFMVIDVAALIGGSE